MYLFNIYAFNSLVNFNFEEKNSSDSGPIFSITHFNCLMLYDALSSTFITFSFTFAVTEISPELVNFLCRWAASAYPLCCEVPLCLLISFSPPCATLKSLPHKSHEAKPSLFRHF